MWLLIHAGGTVVEVRPEDVTASPPYCEVPSG
jgi:hypothetical protein